MTSAEESSQATPSETEPIEENVHKLSDESSRSSREKVRKSPQRELKSSKISERQVHKLTNVGEAPGWGGSSGTSFQETILKSTGMATVVPSSSGRDTTEENRKLSNEEMYNGESSGGHSRGEMRKCDISDKTFELMLVHTAGRPYKCDICGKGFNQNSTMTMHRLVHVTNEQCTCEFCGNSYTGLKFLNLHRVKHKGRGQVEIGKNLMRKTVRKDI